MKKLNLRISPLISGLITGLALIYDGLQAGIDLISFGTIGWLINPLISFWAFMTFLLWFYLYGIRFVSPAKIGTMGGTLFLEFIPLINSLPTWTFGVILMLAIAYAEDITAAVSPQMAKALSLALGDKKSLTKPTVAV